MTNTKKILGIVLALIVLTLAMSISIFATETVAEEKGYMLVIYNEDGTEAMTINGTNSISEFNIKSALSSAYTFGDNAFLFGISGTPTYELILLQDVETAEMVAIPAGKNVVVNLNGYNITSGYQEDSTTKHIYPFDVYGNLTITDETGNGSITGRGIFVQDGSTVTVEGGSIYGIDSNGGSALFQYGGDIVINGGRVEQKAEGTYNFAINANGGTVTVNGGWVGGNHGAIAAGGAAVEINGGTLVCTGTAGMTDNVLYTYGDGSIVINGGTFIADNDGPAGGCCVYDANGKTTVNAGNFSNSSGGDVWGTTGTTINGGTFENLIETSHVTVGSTIVNGGKALTKTESGELVEAATEIKVATLAELIEALKADNNLPIVATAIIVIDGDTVLDLNGKTVKAENMNVIKNNSGNLVITNGTIERTGTTAGYAFNVVSGTVKLENVTIIGGMYTSGTSAEIVNSNISQHHSSRHTIYAYNCKVDINGGTYHNYNAGNSTIFAAGTSVVTIENGTFSIDNGKATHGWTSCMLDASNGGAYVINGGEFKGHFRVQANSSMTINGGTFENTHGEGYSIYSGGVVTVKGGTFTDASSQAFAKSNLAEGYELGEDGKVNSTVSYVAEVNGVGYETLEEAFAAAQAGDTIVLLADATPALTSQRAITKAAVIDLGGKTLTLKEDDLYFGTTTFKNGTIVVDPSVKASTAVFWMFKDQTLTFDNVKVVATGVTGTYLIGLDGNNSDLNLLNGSEILIENTSALDLDVICVNASTGNDIVIDNSKVNVTNLDGRVFFRGNYTVKGASEIALSGITKAGFRIEANQTLSIEDTAKVTIAGEPRDGGIHITDASATYTKAETATVTATVNQPITYVASVNGVGYATFAEALAAASAMTGDVVVEILDKVTLNTGLAGSYDSIEFVGKTATAEIYLDVQGYITATGKKVAFKDLTLSKSAGGFITNAGFMNVAFGIYDVTEVTYTNCTFANGAYASSGNVTYTDCTFYRSHDKYGLWAYGNANVTVDGCTFDDYRGIKLFSEAKTGETTLTVTNTTFTDKVNNKPAIVLTYGESVTLAGNTYSSTGVFELDLDGAPNGVPVTSDVPPTCVNDNGACGVIVDGKIYTTVAQAAEVAVEGSKVTLLYNSAETVELPAGVELDKNGFDAAGITVKKKGLSGTGTEADPFLITSLEDLIWFRDNVNAGNSYAGQFVKLTADIDLNQDDWTPIKKFNGTFDGNGKTISNLWVTGSGAIGFFAQVADQTEHASGTVKNITFNNATIISSNDVAGLIADARLGARINNVKLTGEIQIQGYRGVGGIVGAGFPVMDGCSVEAEGTITATYWGVGGILGFANDAGAKVSNSTIKSVGAGLTIHGELGGVGAVTGTPYGASTNGATVSGVELTSNNNYYMGYIDASGTVNGNVTVSDTVVKVNGKEIVGRDAVASIGTKAYFSLQAAIEAVKEGETIVLLKNITVTTPAYSNNALNYAKAVNCTIDLGGYTLTADTGNSVLRFNIAGSGATSNVTVTLKNGKVVAGSNTWCAVMASGISADVKAIFNLEDLTIESSKAGDLAVKAWANAVINAKNVTVNATNGAGGFYAVGGEIVLDNCTVNQKGLHTAPYLSMAIAVSTNGKLTVNSGSYTSEPTAAAEGYNQGTSHGSWCAGVMNSGGTLIINGGTFANGNFGDDSLATAARGLILADTASVVQINGGTFNALKSIIDYQNNLGVQPNPNVVIAGGTFSADPSVVTSYGGVIIAEGYEVVENADGTYGVVEAGLKGTGTEADPYQIGSLKDLILFRDSVNAGETKYNAKGVYVALTANIDMASVDWSVNIGDDCNATFDGIFDGKGYTIYNLNSTETAQKADGYVCTGLFGAIYGSAVVKNLTIENVSINTGDFTGSNVAAVVGFAYNCTGSIENVKVIGNININAAGIAQVGTIVGYDYYGKLTIKDCVVSGNNGSYIKGSAEVGGIVGYSSTNSLITNCTVENIAIEGKGLVGGIAGIALYSAVVKDSTVKNVALVTTGENWINGSAIAIGSISNSGTTVSNITYENVTANGTAINRMVGSAYAEKPTTVVPAVQAQIGDKYYVTYKEAFNAAVNGDTIVILVPGEFETTVAQGLVAIKNLDGNYVVGVAPTATVKDYGPTIIAGGDYGIWDGKNYTSTSTADMPLSFVMQFIADQTAADMANSPYADWYADFVITFDGLENDAFIADGCYLAGFYGDFGWVKIPVDGMTIEEGVRYPVMLGVGLGQKYDYVCSGVKDFKCALYITPEILAANPNLTVNLELAAVDNSKGQDAAAEAMVNGTSYNVTDYDYVAEDFQITVATVGEKKFTTLQAAIDYAIANGGKVTLVSSVNINEGIVINGNVEIDLAGYTVALDSNVANCVFNIENGTVAIANGTIYTNNGQAIYAGLDKDTSYAPVVTLENVTLKGADFGLSVFGGANVTIGNGVVISGSVEALRVWNSAQVTVNAGASITCTGNGEVARAIAVYENASVSVTGGTFTGIVDKIAGTLAITGGTFTSDVSAYVAEGYAAIQNLDGIYVVGVAPTATVKDYGPTIIPGGEYGIWDGKNYTSKGTEDLPLSFVMQFIADQTAADMANSPYADWYADFVITFDGLERDTFIADGCYLAGFYGDFGWVKIPVDGMTIEEGVRYPVMLGVGLGQKYDYVCSGVKDFKCALYITPEILAANPNLTVNLELAAVDNSKGQDAAAEAMVNGTSYNVTDYDYVAEDFIVDYVAAVGNKQFTSLADAIAYANANGGTVTLLDNIELDAPIVVTGTVTLDLAGYTINYNSTTMGEAMITNKGNLTINDSVGTGVIYYNYTGANDSSYGKGNYTISNSGTLTINGGEISIANLRAHAKYPIDNNSTTGDAILVINGGHLYNYNTSAIRMFCNSTTYKNSVTINGGLIEGYCAIWVQNPGKNTVNCDLTVTGGEIRTTAAAYVNGTAALEDVSSSIYFTISGNGGAWSEGSFVSLTGGIFNENVYLAEQAPASITIGEEAIFNGYLELPMVPVASVNGIDFATLAEAIAYANANGGTVTLLDNIALSETIAVTGTVTLNLNGYTITGTDNSTKSFSLFTNKGTFTITGNGAITLVATNNRAWNNYSSVISNTVGGKLIVEGGTIEHLGGTDMAYAIDNLTNGKGTYAETVVNGGLVKSTYRAIRQFLNGIEAQNILTINGGTIEGANKAIFFQDPSANANTGSLTIGENAVVTGGVYLFVTAGSTEWPVEVSIATSALANGVNDVTSKNVPEGYFIKEANGVIGVEKIDVPADVQWYDITLSLESDLKINYYLLTSTLYEGYNYYARVIKHHDTGCNDHAKCEVHYIPMSKWAIGDTYTRIAVDGIAAKDMACQVEVQIFVGEMPEDYTVKHDSSVTTGATFGPAAGSVAVSLTGRMSILQYCKTVFSVSGEGYEQYEAVKPLLAKLLLYGEASQKLFGHYITADDGVTPIYVTNGIEELVKSYATPTERTVENHMKWLGGDQNYFWDFTLSLETTTYLNFYFQNLTAEGTGIADFNANNIKAHVTFNHYDGKAHDKVYSVADGTMLIDENGYAVVVIDDLAPADLFDVVHVELFYGETALAEFQASAESYCYIVYANPEAAGEALVKLCDAIVALAEEAKEYFTNKSN